MDMSCTRLPILRVQVKEEPKQADEEAAVVKVDAKTVKALRALSSAGMMDCKKALAVNNNDIDAAAVRCLGVA
jgi:hypothetical protein